MDGSNLLPVCAADGVELRPAAMPKMVTNRATNEPEVVLILWSLSAVLSERSEHWNHWEAETRGIRLWSPYFYRFDIHWISRDSILYSVCFKIYSQDTIFLEVFRKCFVAGPWFWLEVPKSTGRESWGICTFDRGAEVRLHVGAG